MGKGKSRVLKMKTKLVQYVDMFNPAQTIVAKNKLVSELESHRIKMHEYVNINTCEAAQYKKCRCKHPNFINGVCHYRTCNHDEKYHH